MKRSASLALVLAIGLAGCAKSSTSPSTTPTKPTFSADLRTANEVPPITGPEATGSGTATVTLDVTRDASNNVTACTGTFVVNLSGFPAGTPINIAHIHQAAAGATGGIVFSTNLVAGELNLATGSGSFTKGGIAPAAIATCDAIIANPAGFYFNVHSTLNPGGVARGQLVKVS